MVYLGPVQETFPTEGYRFLYPAAMSLFGFIAFSVLRIPKFYSNALYLVPLVVSIILAYGMFWFIWIYFGIGVAIACLAAPYVLAEMTGVIMPIWVRSVLLYLAFVGAMLCADFAVNLGKFG